MAIDINKYFNDPAYKSLDLSSLNTLNESVFFSSETIERISKVYISQNGDCSCFPLINNFKIFMFERGLKRKLNSFYFDNFDKFEDAKYVIENDRLAQINERNVINGFEEYDLREYLTGIKDPSQASEKEKAAAGEKLWKRVAELYRIYKSNPIKDNQPAPAGGKISPPNPRDNLVDSRRGPLFPKNDQDPVEVIQSSSALVNVPLSPPREGEIPSRVNQPDSGFENIEISNSNKYQDDLHPTVDNGSGKILEDDQKEQGVVGLGSSSLYGSSFCQLHAIIDGILGDKAKIQEIMNNITKSSSALSKNDLIQGLNSLRSAIKIDPSEITKVKSKKITFYISNRGIYLHLNRTSSLRDINLNDKENQRNIGYLIFISGSEVKRLVCKTIHKNSSQFKRRMCELEIAKKLKGVQGVPHIEQAFIAKSLRNRSSSGVEKLYIFEQTVDGSDLNEFMQNKFIDGKGKKQIMLKLLNILKEMHKRGVVHGDVKPENILVSYSQTKKEYEVLVFDFDVSFDIREVNDVNSGFGTLKYAAPEMLDQSGRFKKRGQVPAKHCSPALDVYSLGATFCWLLGKSTAGKKGLTQLLSGMLEVDPEKRLKIPDAIALCKNISLDEFS